MKYPKFWFIPPFGLRNLFQDVVWVTKNNHVLISFDDGPTNDTLRLLDLLDEISIKSLFFLKAGSASEKEEVVKEIVNRGHLVGNHSLSHKKLRFAPLPVLEEEIVTSKRILEELTGTEIKFFRPPYGAFDPRVLKQIKKSGQTCVMWDLLSADYLGDVYFSINLINQNIKQNSIIVLHDNRKTKDFLHILITETTKIIASKNFLNGAPSECLS